MINNGVDTNKFRPHLKPPPISNKLKLITVAALEERKEIQWVINTLENYKTFDFEYHIYGQGPFEAEIRQAIKDKELEDKIELKAPIDNLQAFKV